MRRTLWPMPMIWLQWRRRGNKQTVTRALYVGLRHFLGLRLAPQKIRSSTTLSPPGQLTYYDWEWNRLTRDFGGADTSITILGVLMSANGSWTAQYHHLLAHCHKLTQTIGHKMASLSLKSKVLVSSTLAQKLYRTQVIAL